MEKKPGKNTYGYGPVNIVCNYHIWFCIGFPNDEDDQFLYKYQKKIGDQNEKLPALQCFSVNKTDKGTKEQAA